MRSSCALRGKRLALHAAQVGDVVRVGGSSMTTNRIEEKQPDGSSVVFEGPDAQGNYERWLLRRAIEGFATTALAAALKLLNTPPLTPEEKAANEAMEQQRLKLNAYGEILVQEERNRKDAEKDAKSYRELLNTIDTHTIEAWIKRRQQ
jgi:hypothetical protein